MIRELSIANLSTQKGDILTAIQELSGLEDAEKILNLKLQSTTGTIPDALEVINSIHTSVVDLSVEANGDLQAAGLLLAAAGKKNFRKAHYAATFMLSSGASVAQAEEGRRKKMKDPYTSCIIETLVSLGAKRSGLADVFKNQSFITATDAKRLKIIDDSGIVKSKYIEEKKKEVVEAQVAP